MPLLTPLAVFFQPLDNNGQILVGGLVAFKATGTDEDLDTYADANAGAFNTNPVELDGNGRANIFLQPGLGYDITLKTSEGVLVAFAEAIIASAASVAL